jgi:hypothetical protein
LRIALFHRRLHGLRLSKLAVFRHRSGLMARQKTDTETLDARSRSDTSLPSAEVDSVFQTELIKIIQALARAAAREDHRKAAEADTVTTTEADQE